MTLTTKQEAFAQAIADGLTQADAYRKAFNAEKMKDSTIYARASELMADGKVPGRVAELRSKLEKKALWTREMSVTALVKAYRVAESQTNASGMTGAVKELNMMHGYNEPTKHDLMSSDGTMTPKVPIYKIVKA